MGEPAMNTVDCHAHVFDPTRFAFAENSAYIPVAHEIGTAEDFLAVLDAHGLSHGLLVNPTSGYGTDNRCMLDAIAHSNGRLQGIAKLSPGVSASDLADLAAGGIVGARFDLIGDGLAALLDPPAIKLLQRIGALGWIAEVQCEGDQFAKVKSLLDASGASVIVDHCGRPDVTQGLAQPGFQALLAFGRAGRGAVKLSGPFRFSRTGPPYRDVDPYVAALIDAFTPERCVWGSDWPFLRIPARIDYGPVLDCLTRWLPDERERRCVLWDTPARLFGFR